MLRNLLFCIVACSSVACSSSGGDTSSPTPNDTGSSVVDSGAPDVDSSMESDSSAPDGTTSEDATADTASGDAAEKCGSDPKLHPPAAGEGVFCPGVGDGGSGAPCATGQICCDVPKGSTPASSCIASTGSCPTSMPKPTSSWACDAPAQCGAGKVCCGLGTPKPRAGCTYDEVFPAEGSKCAASCGAGEYIVCEADADCPTGKTCVAIKSGSKQVGYCK